MIRPINIYSLSRISSINTFNILERHHSQNEDIQRRQEHEIQSLKILVDNLINDGTKIFEFDGFFYGFKIPQIGKEFDLLKFTEKYCLNIELKSQNVSQEQILKQLIKNRYYLKHLGKRMELYTIITDTLMCYKLSMNNELILTNLSEVKERLQQISRDYLTRIDNLFSPSEYLVSPLNTPERFIQGEYFLTQNQEQIKSNILKSIDNAFLNAYFHLTGKPGTGKTLLLYDLAKELSQNGKVLLIHCGKIVEGQLKIRNEIRNLNIISAKELNSSQNDISNYNFDLVDESHRIYEKQFKEICDSIIKNNQICIFSSDPEQILSSAEENRNIVKKIKALQLTGDYELSEKIRTNKELHSFIMCLKNLNHKPKTKMNYSNVQLNYANDVEETKYLLEYYKQKGYVFINYSKSNYDPSPYSAYEEDFDTHHVIGQEFDKIVMLMDKSFYYDDNNNLCGIPHPNPDYLYPNLFYQGVTRVRMELSIIVVDAIELFEKITSIVT